MNETLADTITSVDSPETICHEPAPSRLRLWLDLVSMAHADGVPF